MNPEKKIIPKLNLRLFTFLPLHFSDTIGMANDAVMAREAGDSDLAVYDQLRVAKMVRISTGLAVVDEAFVLGRLFLTCGNVYCCSRL